MADMGSLQRLPYIVGHGTATELALTARTFDAAEAKQLHLVSQVGVGLRELGAAGVVQGHGGR